MGREKHTRTIGWLKSKGIHGEECLDDLDAPIIQETGTCREGSWVVFEDEGKFWRMEIEHHPEDYSGTNDLHEWRNEPDQEMEVVEVVRRFVPTWVETGTADANRLAPVPVLAASATSTSTAIAEAAIKEAATIATVLEKKFKEAATAATMGYPAGLEKEFNFLEDYMIAEKQEAGEDDEARAALQKIKTEVAFLQRRHLEEVSDSLDGLTISLLIREAHGIAVEKGWWSDEAQKNVPSKCMLMVSEISEALEEYRKGQKLDRIYCMWKAGGGEEVTDFDPDFKEGVHETFKPEGFPVEMADLLIRVFDFCGYYQVPLERALRLKLAYNRTRGHKHGGKVC